MSYSGQSGRIQTKFGCLNSSLSQQETMRTSGVLSKGANTDPVSVLAAPAFVLASIACCFRAQGGACTLAAKHSFGSPGPG